MIDWLGNPLNVGDLVVYSSKSSLTGMNLGEITSISDTRIQIKLWSTTERFAGTTYMPTRIITLLKGSSAHRSVTRYLGKVPVKDEV